MVSCCVNRVLAYLPLILQYLLTSRRYHGNNVVEEDGRYKTSLEIDQKLYYIAKLEITNVETSDQGTYRAVAKNKYGEGVATINLNFEGSDKPKYDMNVNYVSMRIYECRYC